MKTYFLVSFLVILSVCVFAQPVVNVEDQSASSLSDSSLMIIGDDSLGVFVARKATIEALRYLFSPIRTKSNQAAHIDSVAILKGLSLYDDSTVVNNTLKTTNLLETSSLFVANTAVGNYNRISYMQGNKIALRNWGSLNGAGDNLVEFQNKVSLDDVGDNYFLGRLTWTGERSNNETYEFNNIKGYTKSVSEGTGYLAIITDSLVVTNKLKVNGNLNVRDKFGVTADSTVVNNELTLHDKLVLTENNALTHINQGKGSGSMRLSATSAHGIMLEGRVTPNASRPQANLKFAGYANLSESNADSITQNGVINFNVYGSTYKNDIWQGITTIDTMPLFVFEQPGSKRQITIFNDSVKIQQDFSVTDNSATTKYFEVTADSTVINNQLKLTSQTNFNFTDDNRVFARIHNNNGTFNIQNYHYMDDVDVNQTGILIAPSIINKNNTFDKYRNGSDNALFRIAPEYHNDFAFETGWNGYSSKSATDSIHVFSIQGLGGNADHLFSVFNHEIINYKKVINKELVLSEKGVTTETNETGWSLGYKKANNIDETGFEQAYAIYTSDRYRSSVVNKQTLNHSNGGGFLNLIMTDTTNIYAENRAMAGNCLVYNQYQFLNSDGSAVANTAGVANIIKMKGLPIEYTELQGGIAIESRYTNKVVEHTTSVNEKGHTTAILTTAEYNAIKTDLGGSIPDGFTFWHDSNADGVGDTLLSFDGFALNKIDVSTYTGTLTP
tara:strand:+ start:14176 stop:16356 length:2181 start_codon:yes stop_codon:yes gene_type:complete